MNGKAKRKNRTLTKLVVAILLESGTTPSWWGEIIKAINYVLEGFLNQPSWGCLAYVRIPYPKRRKLTSRAYEYVFI